MYLSTTVFIKLIYYKHVFISWGENRVYLDQLDSLKPADLALHCFKTGYIKSLALKSVNWLMQNN